jgi:phosphopantetheinyl transferase
VKEDASSQAYLVPRYFGHLPGYGADGIVRRPWRRAGHLPAHVKGWCCQCLEENADVTWDQDAARYILGESEWRIWHRLENADMRHRWMRGRVAAKDAVRLLLLERHDLAATLETIGIVPDEHGCPQVYCATLPDRGEGLCVSISHCGNTAVALAAERSEFCRGVGIDVAARTDNHEGLVEGGFAADEMTLLRSCPGAERGDWLLGFWCAKEAVGKALGVGLMGNPLHYTVREMDRDRHTVEVAVNIANDPAYPIAGQDLVTARVGCDRGMAYAVVGVEGK